ncbi:hypothetical protein [Sphingomonas sp.]|jgi:hypothetical protein|uniref:hypothetical protein n=1 Tax=Sphingomonas sp. TaxID=28214 RepID=UPI00260E5FFB|nr:hypothetical protein [Sphingomonas sp.]
MNGRPIYGVVEQHHFDPCPLPGEPEDVSFRLPREAKRLLSTVADGMAASPDVRWTCAELRVEQDGRYGTSYRYDPPHRLAGNLLDVRLRGYRETWLASEHGAAIRAAAAPRWRRMMG